MQSKGLLSLVMLVAIGSVSLSTSVAGHNVDLDGTDAMEEMALIMAAAAGQEFTANAMGGPSIKCIQKDGWSKRGDLTLSKLNSMMSIFKGKPWSKYVPSKTFLFAPQCPNLITKGHVYISGRGKHAEDNMAEKCGLPTEFYLTSAPCPDCAMMLYNAYKNEPKPTIHIARPYRGGGKTGVGNIRLNKKCLAMLVNAGFVIIPWDWKMFARRYITNDKCKAVLNEMTGHRDDLYDKRYKETIKVVDIVNGMHRPIYYEICSNALKKGKKCNTNYCKEKKRRH